MQAGWYDDGSGRQRWWDGERWTDDVAPGAAATPAGVAAPVAPAPAARPVLGFVGLGAAVLGTILACIPAVFVFGAVVLLAGFVLSLIGLFAKGVAKWPSIVGMILAVVGGVIGTVVLLVSTLLNFAPPTVPAAPTSGPSVTVTEQPSGQPTTGTSDARPSPEQIADGFAEGVRAGGVTEYDDMPEFYPCVGQYFYDSELSDEALQIIAAGEIVTGSETDAVVQVSYEATLECDPAGEGAN